MYLYLVLIICLLLAVFTVWKEYSTGKQRLGWRITASLLAVIALAGIALPLNYWGEKKLAANEAVLLTDGFNTDSLNALKNDSILTFDPAVKKQYAKAVLITPDQLKTLTPVVTRLHIYGYGLTKPVLDELDSLPGVFHPPSQPFGVSAINWNGRLKQGQHLIVQGTFNNSSDKLVRLILKGLNTSADSVIIQPKSNSKFNLTDLPKGLGQSVYQLIAVSDKDTVFNEDLPVNIEPVKPLKILMLSAFPGFEDRFLKNWLSANGFSVVIRSAISKDKFNREFINTAQFPLNNLSASMLDKFDILISDLSVLRSLNATENSILKQQVNQKGLGLIVKTDTIFKTSSWLQAGFTVTRSLSKEQKSASLIINGKKAAAKISNAGQLFINYQNGTQALINDEQNRMLAGIDIAGNGKIAFTTLNDTYTWMLAGNKNDYAAFWSLLISKASHTLVQPQIWQTVATVPAVNEPEQLQVETGAQVVQMSIDSTLLSASQNPLLGFQWQGTWWPKQPGWHAAKLSGGSPEWFYVFKETDWKSIKTLKRIRETKIYALGIKTGIYVTKQIHQKKRIPVPKIYFYALLLIACTYLWIEGKAQFHKPR